MPTSRAGSPSAALLLLLQKLGAELETRLLRDTSRPAGNGAAKTILCFTVANHRKFEAEFSRGAKICVPSHSFALSSRRKFMLKAEFYLFKNKA